MGTGQLLAVLMTEEWGQVNNRQEWGYRSYLPGNRLNQ